MFMIAVQGGEEESNTTTTHNIISQNLFFN
jgi:hypothetical protein